MNRRTACIGISCGAVVIAGMLMLMSLRHTNERAGGQAPSAAEMIAVDRDELDSPPLVAANGDLGSPPASNPDVVATREPHQPNKPSKPIRLGLASARLPTPDFMRSEPPIAASPVIRQGLEARARRASMLDRRLEIRIAQLKIDAENASPERRQVIERDITILESQLNARRPWESATAVPHR